MIINVIINKLCKHRSTRKIKNCNCKYGDGANITAKFQAERMDPSTVLSSSDTELARLGVATIGDRIRLRELCKEAEENARQPQPTRVST